ncbi:core histone macro-H2A.1-like isoform X1 [Biomphalaria glabrata]|uniref:Histone H2A n=1 Tax=Biomphalaria glabrata TaxID=6526 RepID=A0A2C9KCD7_BIOGL|nr:core histone macro-H2A.1-like isoform X1 [Biomphalaria glabrata]KAI8765635.1 core histone macro-H2A.1-like isoform X1 [Biomphalaria glabrata]
MSARGGKKKQKVLSRSARAGVLFPVARMLRYLRKDTHHLRIGAGSPVYMAAVIEYLVAEILELAGNAAKEFKRGRITPRHILLAIANDDELHQLLKHVTIAQGGVVPKIHAALIGPSRGKHSAVSTSPSASGVSSPSKLKAATKAIAKKIKASTSPVVNNVSVFKGKPKKADSIPDGSGGFLTLSEKKLFLGQKLTVMQGDIVKMVADAIVHPTNSTYHLGGEVGQAILKAGGKEFQQEIDSLLKNQGSIATAEAAICPGHKFSAKFVIHVNSPTWGENNSQQNLDKAVKNVLKLADDKQLKSLAIPSISSGNAGFPKQTAAQIILASIRDYFSNAKTTSLKQIYFVLFDAESVNVYTTELARLDG